MTGTHAAVTGTRAAASPLHVRVSGSGPALLLLHGFTGSGGTWDRLAAALPERRSIAPDLLGHGRSAAPTDPARYALERQADDLADLLRTLGEERTDVIGYSMGARLALVLALRHRALVRSLLLESPSAGIADDAARACRREEDEARALRLEQDGLDAFVAEWEQQPIFASHAALPDEVRARLRRERLGHDPRGLAASLRGAGQGVMVPLHDVLPEVDAAALIVAGELDEGGRERAAVVTAAIRGARLAIVAGAGHTPHVERPEAFFDLVRGHLPAAAASHPIERT